MTYLYITPFFPSPISWQGAYCFDFIKALKRTHPRLRIEVFMPGEGGDYDIDGIKVWRFKERILYGFVFPFLFRESNEHNFLMAVRRSGIDVNEVVVCHGNTARMAIYPLAIKRQNPQCKTLLHHHDLASFGLNLGILHRCAFYNYLLFKKLSTLHEQIDCHVFISEASKRSFLLAPNTDWTVYNDYKTQMRGPKFFNCRTVKIKNSVILHNGVDVEIFKSQSKQSARNGFVIGCIGNFDVLKDQITLLKAIDIINKKIQRKDVIKIVFIGNGLQRVKCEVYAKEFGIDAEFRSEVRHKELSSFYHEIDLFVLPSYFEGFGCVYTEAWASGVPFIACEGQGIEDMIPTKDKDKWLCKPMDAEDLAKKIMGYMENRWEQKLCGSIDINDLVEGFCNQIGI